MICGNPENNVSQKDLVQRNVRYHEKEKKWQDVLTIERSNDVCGESASDGEDDSDIENDVCVCLVMRRSEHGGSMLLDDTSTFT